MIALTLPVARPLFCLVLTQCVIPLAVALRTWNNELPTEGRVPVVVWQTWRAVMYM